MILQFLKKIEILKLFISSQPEERARDACKKHLHLLLSLMGRSGFGDNRA